MKDHAHCPDHGRCIDVSDVGFHFNGTPVLEHITFSIRCGEYLGIVGPNGGGKTTLLKLMLGLLEPSHGEVTVLDHPPKKLPERYRIGYVPQGIAHANPQFPATVREIVESGTTPRKGLFRFTNQEARVSIEEACDRTGTKHLEKRLIGDLSGGERQRVFIARALAGKPDILMLDEPTVGVDIDAKEQFYTFLGALNKDLGLTIIFVTHDTDVIANEAQTILCINRTLVCHESSKEWRSHEHVSHLYGKNVHHITHSH